jgi:hypothetical protein
MRNNKFNLNLALKDGGAIKWIGNQPEIMQNNIFHLNKAVYGVNIGSYPIRLGLEIYEKNSSNLNKLFYTSKQSSQNITLPNINVGGVIQYTLVFSVLDAYDKVVNSVKG